MAGRIWARLGPPPGPTGLLMEEGFKPRRGRRRPVDLSPWYPPRRRDVRKGDFGRVVVAGGSDCYSGCLALNALAALRAGADLTVVVAPRRAADIVAGYSPDLITIPCETPFPDPSRVLEALAGADALVVGGGVARTPEAHAALLAILRDCPTPAVADAEALRALASNPSALRAGPVLLTPHPGEYELLAGKPWPTPEGERRAAARALALRYQVTVIVKGARDVVSDGKHVHVDLAGSPYMTKGGYGDLLAGAAGAHLARGRTPFDAARAAAHIVGRAGELAAKEFGEATLATDALTQFPRVLWKQRRPRVGSR